MQRLVYKTCIFLAVLSATLLVCMPFQDSPVKFVPIVLAYILYLFIVRRNEVSR